MMYKLEEVDTLFHENKELVTMQVTSMAAEAEAERIEAEHSIEMIYCDALDSLSKVLTNEFDPIHGGFGIEPKFPFPDAVRFAFLRYRKTGDKAMLDMALKTLDSLMHLSDPVWGGFYRYSMTRDWSEPHYEKLLNVQAGIMDNYLEAYQVTGEDKYGETAAGIKAYVEHFLADNANGGFYGSQDADIVTKGTEGGLVVGESYFNKSESDRLSIGVPYVDKTIYTDWNGLMISTYLRFYQVMDDERAREFALKTVDRLLSDNMCDGRMCHYSNDGPVLKGILSDQVYFAQALVDAYEYSGNRHYLSAAESLVDFMESDLRDVVDGGYYFRTFDPHSKAEQLERHKPFDENVAAVSLLTRLGHLSGNERYRQLAERTLRATSHPQATQSTVGMGFALAVDTFVTNPLHIVLVGRKNTEEMQRMLLTSLHAYVPEKLVQILDPDAGNLSIGDLEYEASDVPVAYVCAQNVCQPPIKDVEELALLLKNAREGRELT
jgi:hypothetical protein